MQALESFISPVPGFDGDILILAIPVSTWPPGDKSMSDPSTEVSASALKTWAGKRKLTANPTPPKKARKTMGKSIGKIKINELAPNVPASTPQSGPRRKIPIQCTKRYARVMPRVSNPHDYVNHMLKRS
jgi:hypothetical protein